MIRKSVDRQAMQTLVHAFINYRLDYCNSFFYGVTDQGIAAFQSIQNRAAKVVVGGSKFNHVMPILKQLHLLTVIKRIIFKLAVITFKSVKLIVWLQSIYQIS